MSTVMEDTIKQLYNLLWFCKKIQIPFEVYALHQTFQGHIVQKDTEMQNHFMNQRDDLVSIDKYFSLMNLFTSKVRGRELEDQMLNIYRIVKSFRNYNASRVVPMGMGLSGTPLNETIVALHSILPRFQKQNKLEKVNCVILTDGEVVHLHIIKQYREIGKIHHTWVVIISMRVVSYAIVKQVRHIR